MEEISALAGAALLPSVKVVDDRCSFEENFKVEFSRKVDRAATELKKLILNCPSFPTQENWTTDSQEVISLLILCGEHRTVSDWNTQELVNYMNELLELIFSKFSVENSQQMFSTHNLAKTTLQHLKPKLKKTELKSYPAAVNCFSWVVTNTLGPHIDLCVDLAVPMSLVLFDDWEADYQQMGLDCLAHILMQNPSSLFLQGWPAVIFTSLKKNCGHNNKLKLFQCMDLALKSQKIDSHDPCTWNKENQYDLLMADLLQSMLLQDPLANRNNLEILLALIPSMGIRVVKFLTTIILTLDNLLTVGVESDIQLQSVKVMEQIIEFCWPCLHPQFINQLSWLMIKLETVLNDDPELQRLRKCQKLLEDLRTS